jgi:hypothetical protein
VLILLSLFTGLSAGSFTLLAYTSTQDPLPLPEKWNDADPHLIDKGKVEQVRLRSFSTNVHKMEVSALVQKEGNERRDTRDVLLKSGFVSVVHDRQWSPTGWANRRGLTQMVLDHYEHYGLHCNIDIPVPLTLSDRFPLRNQSTTYVERHHVIPTRGSRANGRSRISVVDASSIHSSNLYLLDLQITEGLNRRTKMDPHAQENRSATVEEVDVDIGFQVSA